MVVSCPQYDRFGKNSSVVTNYGKASYLCCEWHYFWKYGVSSLLPNYSFRSKSKVANLLTLVWFHRWPKTLLLTKVRLLAIKCFVLGASGIYCWILVLELVLQCWKNH
uniref:Ovule protein n=1 Tax=Angiostrongylus cantonensis TaxID=6313 RepID=A0A0K0D071_ANGCA